MINEAADWKVSVINRVRLYRITLEAKGNTQEITGLFERYFGKLCGRFKNGKGADNGKYKISEKISDFIQ